MGGFLLVGNYIFAYVYPLSFIGALIYSTASIMNSNPSDLIKNPNIAIAINAFLCLCGLISIFNWFNNTPIPVLGPILLPDGQDVIKTQI